MNVQENDITRKCPKCGKVHNYKGESAKKNRDKAERRRSVCLSCSKFGHKVSEQTRVKISKHRRGKLVGKDNPFYGKKHPLSFIRKMRLFRLERASSHGRVFNPKGCKIFDEINKTLGWQGIHGTNGGEFIVRPLGYVVDYYEPNLNVVIEYDEPHHNRSKQIPKDIARQKEIVKHLKCKFFRIKEGQDWRQVLYDFSGGAKL